MYAPAKRRAQDHEQISPSAVLADDPLKKALHWEIAHRYAWEARKAKRRRRTPLIPNLRLRELERIFAHRYGSTLPDDDAGRDDLFVAAQHIAQIAKLDLALPAWARFWAPWLSEADCAELIARVLARPLRWKADKLAWWMGLTDATRTLLEITTIGAIDCSKAEREKRRKERKAAAQRERRKIRASGRNRPQPLSATRPWIAAGISRATWFRRRRETVRLKACTAESSHYAVHEKSLTSVPRFTSGGLIRVFQPPANPDPNRKTTGKLFFLSRRNHRQALCA